MSVVIVPEPRAKFQREHLNLFANASTGIAHRQPPSGKFACAPRNRGIPDGDGFADDCLHRQ